MSRLRVCPPVAACPIGFTQLWRGLCGVFGSRGFRDLRRQEFASELGVTHVYGLSSGKAALYLALQALRSIHGGTEVVVPAYGCFSIPSAIVKAGLTVVPCDVDPETFDFDYGRLEGAMTPKTLCVVATHLFGMPADMKRIMALAAERGLYVIEDAAQGFGEIWNGTHLGTQGDLGIYSFGRGKHLTSGSGGLLVTRRKDLAVAFDVIYKAIPESSMTESWLEWCRVALMALFIRPSLYWLPALLPVLNLGKTIFDTRFDVKKLSEMKAGLLDNWKVRLQEANEMRQRNLRVLDCLHQGKLRKHVALPLLRMPLLAKSQIEREWFKERGKSMGISALYPSGIHTIQDVCQFPAPGAYPGATLIAERLLTVPTHHLLAPQDFAAIIQLIQGERLPGDGGKTGKDIKARNAGSE